MKTGYRIAAVVLGLVVFPVAARAAALDEADPLGDISLDMQLVVEELSDLSTGEPTRETQGVIVDKLDQLIAQLEKECEACRGNGSGANPNRPLADSVIIGGPGGSGDLHAPKREGRDWGKLPEKERERILQSLTEGFPAHYQKILERYYKRLADDGTDAADEAPADDEAADDGAEPTESTDEPADEPAAAEAPAGDGTEE